MVSLTWLETIGSRVTWPDKRLETCSFPSLPRILKISNQPSPLVKSFIPYWKWKHFPQHFATSGDERGAFLSVYVEWLPLPLSLSCLETPSLSPLLSLCFLSYFWSWCSGDFAITMNIEMKSVMTIMLIMLKRHKYWQQQQHLRNGFAPKYENYETSETSDTRKPSENYETINWSKSRYTSMI